MVFGVTSAGNVFTRIARLSSFTAAGIAPIVANPSPCSLDARSRFFLPRRGLSTPYFSNGGADGWREGCLQAGAMTATQRAVACRRGRREAVSVTAPQPVDAQDDVIFNEPGRRARVAWGDGGDPMPRVHFGIRHWGGFADNISCAATGKHPSCQPSASQSLVRVAGIRSGASRKCAPVYADSPTNRRSVGRSAARATRGAT